MAKYIFTQDANFRPASSSHLGVKFKKGDIIEGTMVINNKQSEPPNFIEANTPQGKISIGYGGRGGSVVAPYTETATSPSMDNKKQTNNGSSETPQSFFTPKNIIIGVLAIGAVLGLLKWQKVI